VTRPEKKKQKTHRCVHVDEYWRSECRPRATFRAHRSYRIASTSISVLSHVHATLIRSCSHWKCNHQSYTRVFAPFVTSVRSKARGYAYA